MPKLSARVLLVVLACIVQVSISAVRAEPASSTRKKAQTVSEIRQVLPKPEWVRPLPDDLPGRLSARQADGVVRLVDEQYRIGKEHVQYFDLAYNISSRETAEALGSLQIAYFPAYQTIRLHYLKVERDGVAIDKTQTARIEFLQREDGLESGIYSGAMSASFLVQDLRVGDTLLLSYSIVGSNPVFDGKVHFTNAWGVGTRTQYRRLILDYPAGRSIAWKQLGSGEKLSAVTSQQADREELRFEQYALEPYRAEPNTPVDFLDYPMLQFSEYQSWDEVANWAHGVFAPGKALDESVVALARRLRRNTEAETISAALAFVQREIRYFSLAFGEGSHRPSASHLVLSRRYGDCKDKSKLLVELLRYNNIEADPVLLAAGTGRAVDQHLPSPVVFDHAIVRAVANGKEYYLDPTKAEQQAEIDWLGQVHANTSVLVVRPGESQLSLVRSDPQAAGHKIVQRDRYTVETLDGRGTLVRQMRYEGLLAESILASFRELPFSEQRHLIERQVRNQYADATLIEGPALEQDTGRNKLVIQFKVDIPRLVQKREVRGESYYAVRFHPTVFRGIVGPFPAVKRRTPAAIDNIVRHAEFDVEVKWPGTVSVVRDPVAEELTDQHFEFSASQHFHGNTHGAAAKLKILRDRVEPAAVGAVKDLVARMDRLMPSVSIVEQDDIFDQQGATEKLSRYARKIRTRINRRIERQKRAIDSGKLSDAELALEYCTLATNYHFSNQADAAREAIHSGERLGIESDDFEVCRAEFYLSVGDVSRARKLYRQAHLYAPESDGEVAHQFGKVLFLGGEFDSAIDLLAQAVQNTPVSDGHYPFKLLWLVMAYKRAGKALPEHFRDAIAEGPLGSEWPGPAMKLFEGQITVDQFVGLFETMPGDAGSLRRSEGYFYLGQYHLAHGRQQEATEAFNKVVDLGVRMYVEDISARIELANLAGQ